MTIRCAFSTTASISSRRIREARGWWIATTSAEILNPVPRGLPSPASRTWLCVQRCASRSYRVSVTMCYITTASAPHAHVLLAAGVHALHEEELGEALPRELVDLLAVRLHLVGDEQRLEAARRRDRLEERVGRRVLLGPRLLALALALLRLDLLLEQEVGLWPRGGGWRQRGVARNARRGNPTRRGALSRKARRRSGGAGVLFACCFFWR